MYYVIIFNNRKETKTTKDYKTLRNAEKAYNKACEDNDNYVQLFEYASGYEIFDKLIKTNF